MGRIVHRPPQGFVVVFQRLFHLWLFSGVGCSLSSIHRSPFLFYLILVRRRHSGELICKYDLGRSPFKVAVWVIFFSN